MIIKATGVNEIAQGTQTQQNGKEAQVIIYEISSFLFRVDFFLH